MADASRPPGPGRRDGITRRRFIELTGRSAAGLTLARLLPDALFPTAAFAAGDPRLTDDQVNRWFAVGKRPARAGNEVVDLVRLETFTSMVRAIRTATAQGHYIYLANWFVDLRFPLGGTIHSPALGSLLKAACDSKVQVRALFWDARGTQNTPETEEVDGLCPRGTRGAAILDNRTLNLGSHHQKLLIVNGDEGLIAFCGGLDFNPDRRDERGLRFNAGGDTDGAPLHDVHCRVTGPAAWDLLQIFVDRWKDHPESKAKDKRGALLGASTARPAAIDNATHWVQVCRTSGNGNAHAGIGGNLVSGYSGYSFAPHGERTAATQIIRGIEQAEKFIYVEDQYFVDTASQPPPATPDPNRRDVRAALMATLAKDSFKHLTVLIPHSSLMEYKEFNIRRKALIDALKGVNEAKVRIFNPTPPKGRYGYVHDKLWVFDDQFVVIGSANLNRRSFTHDSEVTAGIVDQGLADGSALWFPHRLRMRLWALQLGVAENSVLDPIATMNLWTTNRPATAKFEDYDATLNHDTSYIASWDNIDPDGS